nr:hypothetical protein GCM10020092_084670 [Actinoplanes digitatis]
MTDVQTGPAAETAADQPARTGVVATRRVVLASAGALGAGCLLTACGTGTTGSGSNGANGGDFSNNPAPVGSKGADAGGTGSTSDNDSGGGGTLAAVADVPEGGGVIKGDYVITQPTAGKYKAFSKVCTHAGCDVSKVDGGVIVCPCHGSTFSLEDGSPVSGPANQPLPEKKVTVDGDNIVAA